MIARSPKTPTTIPITKARLPFFFAAGVGGVVPGGVVTVPGPGGVPGVTPPGVTGGGGGGATA